MEPGQVKSHRTEVSGGLRDGQFDLSSPESETGGAVDSFHRMGWVFFVVRTTGCQCIGGPRTAQSAEREAGRSRREEKRRLKTKDYSSAKLSA